MSLVATTLGRLLSFNESGLDRAVPKADGPLDTADFPWMAEIQAHWAEIAAEVEAVRASEVRLPQVNDLAGSDQGNEGSWSNLVIFSYGTWIEVNQQRCPRTAELVRNVPGLQIAGFTVLGPGAHLPRHRGPVRGALRYQVGVIVPDPPGSNRIQVGSVTHVWSPGASMVFDDAVEHEAWNDSDGERFVLFIQFVWPVPGLTGLLNRAIQRMFSLAARGFPKRVKELDAMLNAPADTTLVP